MKIFNENHPGEPILMQAEQNRICQGFFLRSKLERLIQQSGCVGIRFYNAGGFDGDPLFMIAVGVTKTGSELNEPGSVNYQISDPQVVPVPENGFGRELASHLVSTAIQDRETLEAKREVRFTSYFSKTMINQLLAPKSDQPIDGIAFFVVPLEFPGLEDARTHLGVSAILEESEPVVPRRLNEDPPNRIVSDLPCPGHCVAARPADRSGSRPNDESVVTLHPESDSIKYLVVWEVS